MEHKKEKLWNMYFFPQCLRSIQKICWWSNSAILIGIKNLVVDIVCTIVHSDHDYTY